MKYFGTDGIRGIYGERLSDELAYRAGLAVSTMIDGECYVGMDTRPSGRELASALATGLVQGGRDVMMVGVVPSPAISYLAMRHNACGIMISASHNPPEYNGLKFFAPGGYKISGCFESSIEESIDRPPPRIGGGKIRSYDCGRDEYVDWLVAQTLPLGGREIALDCAFGAACTVAREVFERAGASVKMFADEATGERINDGVGALHPEFIAERTDGLGFAFDGDADRLAVTSGGIVDGDSALYNLALLLRPRGVAGTVLANMALERELGKLGVTFIRTAVGDKHLSEAMRRHKFVLGGEQSGHYIISPAVSGDGLLAALMLASMPELVRLDLVPQRSVSVTASPCVLDDENFLREAEACREALRGGRLIVRKSGTEPKIRIMAECENAELLDEVVERLVATIEYCNKERQ